MLAGTASFLAIGWSVERYALIRKHKAEIQRVYDATWLEAHSRVSNELGDYHKNSHEHFPRMLENNQFNTVMYLWKNHDAVNETLLGNPYGGNPYGFTAEIHAGHAMSNLNCETTEQYLALLKEVGRFCPERKSIEYESLVAFLDESVKQFEQWSSE